MYQNKLDTLGCTLSARPDSHELISLMHSRYTLYRWYRIRHDTAAWRFNLIDNTVISFHFNGIPHLRPLVNMQKKSSTMNLRITTISCCKLSLKSSLLQQLTKHVTWKICFDHVRAIAINASACLFVCQSVCLAPAGEYEFNKNSSADEIANVNFFYKIAYVEASAYAHWTSS